MALTEKSTDVTELSSVGILYIKFPMSPFVMTLFLQLLPAALQIAAEDNVDFRKGLPLDYLDYMGVQNSESVSNFLFLFSP